MDMNREEIEALKESAEQGDAKAQFKLGEMYDFGEDVAENKSEAVKWYHKAAEQGHAEAQNSLGTMYYLGKGVPENKNETVKWFHKIAKKKPEIREQLREISQRAELELIRDNAEQGDIKAQAKLGEMHEFGEQGAYQSDNEAEKWYRKAAEQTGDERELYEFRIRQEKRRNKRIITWAVCIVVGLLFIQAWTE